MNEYSKDFAQGALEGERGCAEFKERPKLIMTVGRGASGKSLWARWLVDEARWRGQAMIAADADLINPSLSPFYADAMSLAGGDEDDLMDWIAGIVSLQTETRVSAVVDCGAPAFPLKELQEQLPLVEFLDSNEIDLVVVHLLGLDQGDFEYLRHVQRLIEPAATILVANEEIVPRRRSVETGVREIMEHPAWEAALRRGAKQVVMPMLHSYAREMSALGIGIRDAMRGRSGRGLPALEPAKRHFIGVWIREMEEAFAPVMGSLGCGTHPTDRVRIERN